MGINPMKAIALIVIIRFVVALATGSAYSPGSFGLDDVLNLFSIFIIGTIPGAPFAVQAVVSIVTTGTLVYAIAQLIRGV